MERPTQHSTSPALGWSNATRASEIQGSLLFTNALLLLVGAWATLGFAAVPSPDDSMTRDTPPLALEEYHDACEGGDAAACNNLGVCYRNGYGTEPDDARARDSFERACRAGSADACSNQAALLEADWLSGDAIEPVIELYARACNGGAGLGCSNLGALYARGKGVPRDLALARQLFTRACESGVAVGCENLLALHGPAARASSIPALY